MIVEFQLAFKTPTVAPVMPAPVAPAAVPAIGASVPDDATKQQMVQTMAQQSGMNLEFSTKYVPI